MLFLSNLVTYKVLIASYAAQSSITYHMWVFLLWTVLATRELLWSHEAKLLLTSRLTRRYKCA